MITFLYQKRPDGTFVIAHNGLPYHVVVADPLYEQCVADYAALEEEPGPEPPPAN